MYVFSPNFLKNKNLEKVYERLLKEIVEKDGFLEQNYITIFGKTVAEPRKSVFLNDDKEDYVYSNSKRKAKKFPPIVKILINHLEKKLGVKFNSVMVNWYADGNNYISYHSDDEKEIDQSAGIASLSFGATRKFRLKDDEGKVEELLLNHGSLVYMKEGCQEKYKHSVPKELKIKEPRLNLTFRKHKNNLL